MEPILRSVVVAITLLAFVPSAIRADSTLVLMLRTNPTYKKGEVEDLIEESLKKVSTTGKSKDVVGKIDIKQISAIEYHYYNGLINSKDDPIPLQMLKDRNLELRQ